MPVPLPWHFPTCIACTIPGHFPISPRAAATVRDAVTVQPYIAVSTCPERFGVHHLKVGVGPSSTGSLPRTSLASYSTNRHSMAGYPFKNDLKCIRKKEEKKKRGACRDAGKEGIIYHFINNEEN